MASKKEIPADALPWEPIERELRHPREYIAFECYLELGKNGGKRSLKRVAETLGVGQRNINDYSTNNDWVARAQAFDIQTTKDRIDRLRRERDTQYERIVRTATHTLTPLLKRLEQLEIRGYGKVSDLSAIRYGELALKLMKEGYGALLPDIKDSEQELEDISGLEDEIFNGN